MADSNILTVSRLPDKKKITIEQALGIKSFLKVKTNELRLVLIFDADELSAMPWVRFSRSSKNRLLMSISC